MSTEAARQEAAIKDAIYRLTLQVYAARHERADLLSRIEKACERADHNKNQLYKAKLAIDKSRSLIARLDAKTTYATAPRKTIPAATIKKLVEEIQDALRVAYLESSADI